MGLKATLDSLDNVDAGLHQFYTETGGKFVLQIEDVREHPDVSNLANAYQSEQTKRKDQGVELASLKERYKDMPADFSLDTWNKAKEGKTDPAELQQVRAALEAERDEWKGKAETNGKRIYELTVERDLDAALAKHGVSDPTFLKAARTMLTPSIKVTDDGKPVIETDMGPLPMADYVQRWVTGGEGKAFVSNPKGAGAEGGSGRNTGLNSRGKMTAQQKADYIRDHGQDAYLKLPK